MGSKKIRYKPLKHQRAFQDSIAKKVLLSAGYGAGKSHSLIMKMLKLCDLNRGLPGGLVCPTLKGFKRDILPLIKKICAQNSIKYKYHKTEYTIYFPNTASLVYVFHCEDHGASIVGPNLAWMCINEVSLISKDAYDAVLSRARLPNAPLRQIAMSGTPASFNWLYEHFIENPREDTDVIYGDMRENIHVANDYAKTLMESYDEKMVEQYVEGKFVNLLGKNAVYAFNRNKHVKKNIEKIPEQTIYIAVDFNVDPLAATFFNRMGPNNNHWLQAYDELCLSNSNTYELVNEIRTRLEPGDIPFIYPDPAGNARSTRTRGVTDIDILADGVYESRSQAKEYIKYKKSIQSVRDCLNDLNSAFSKGKILISSKCKNLIADLERCAYKQGSYELDKSDPKRTHFLDGIKNLVNYEFPIRAKLQHWSQQIR